MAWEQFPLPKLSVSVEYLPVKDEVYLTEAHVELIVEGETVRKPDTSRRDNWVDTSV